MTAIEATLWALGSVFVLGAALVTLAQAVPSQARDRGAQSLVQLVVYTVLLISVHRLHFSRTRPSVVFATRPGRWVFYPIAALLGAVIQIPTNALYEVIIARWPTPGLASDLAQIFSTLPLWRKVAAGVGLLVTTPLVEEALFRGAMFAGLRRQHGKVAVVIVTTVLFAIIHLQPQAYLPIGMVGAALAFLRLSSGSMWPCVLLHMTYNSVTFYAIATGADQGPQANEPWPRWLMLAGTVVTAGLLALTDYFRVEGRRDEPAASEEQS